LAGARARLVCNTVDASLAAALDGWGIARLLSYQVAPAVAEGRLRILLSDPNRHSGRAPGFDAPITA
jgi:DNA-binding transcriptional LysR family regulator